MHIPTVPCLALSHAASLHVPSPMTQTHSVMPDGVRASRFRVSCEPSASRPMNPHPAVTGGQRGPAPGGLSPHPLFPVTCPAAPSLPHPSGPGTPWCSCPRSCPGQTCRCQAVQIHSPPSSLRTDQEPQVKQLEPGGRQGAHFWPTAFSKTGVRV